MKAILALIDSGYRYKNQDQNRMVQRISLLYGLFYVEKREIYEKND